MPVGRRLLLLMAVVIFPNLLAAQTAPWPNDSPPQAAGTPPWPGEAGSPVMPPVKGWQPPGGEPGGGAPSCMAEFKSLRDDVEKKGIVAKAAGQKKVGREEMCKYVTTYAEAEAKWVTSTASKVQSCGIPPQIANQLKQVHDNTELTRQKICAAGPVVAPPSFDDALMSLTRMTTGDTSRRFPGVIHVDSVGPGLRKLGYTQ